MIKKILSKLAEWFFKSKSTLFDSVEEYETIKEEEKANYHRAKRDYLLTQADVLLLKYQEQVELGIKKQDDTYRLALLQYKEDLRNVPEQAGFPENVVFPELPK